MSDLHEEEFNSGFNGKTVLRIIREALHYPHLFFTFLIAVSINSLLNAYSTYVLRSAVDDGIIAKNLDVFFHNILLFGLAISGIALFVFIFIVAAGFLSERIQYSLRKRIFEHLQSLPFSYYDKTPVGWIMARMNSDIPRMADFVAWMLLDLTWALMNILASGYFMFKIDAVLASTLIILIPLLVIVGSKFKAMILKEYRKSRSINSKITGKFNENISGIRIVKGLVREKRNLNDFNRLNDEMFSASYRAAWLSAMFLPVVQLLTSLGLAVILWYGVLPSTLGRFTIGSLQAFIGYVGFMMWPIQNIANVYASMQNSIAGGERVFSLLDTKSEIVNRENSERKNKFKGAIEFRDVDFHYEKDKPILRKFNLKVNPGDKIALVGPTGGGKSTIVNLVCRFYEPVGGTILWDGTDYTKFDLQSIYSSLGVVLQTPHLFSGTIRENIRYGNLNAADEDVIAASKLAHAHDFITELENGYDEEVGEGGSLLSVGQKQLISIARAMLAKPEVIILDEATSSIDTVTEHQIQKGIDSLLAGSTSFIIAHRLSTIKDADLILVIEDGRITESGDHKSLIALKGHYYSLYSNQFRAKREKELAFE